MDDYTYKATRLIAEGFDHNDLKYDVLGVEDTNGESEQVIAGFHITNGPSIMVRFVSTDDNNDVKVRAYNIVTDVSKAKRARVTEACNILNGKLRYLKFYLDYEDCVNAEYDFLETTPDEALGEMATEIFCGFMTILDHEYPVFMRAIFTDGPLDDSGLVHEIDEWRRENEDENGEDGADSE